MTPEPFAGEGVRGFLHRPSGAFQDAVVLSHGAGSNANAPLLVALCDVLADSGCLALRIDLPFRRQRPFGPPFPAMAARDREGLRQAAGCVRALGAQRVILGGHSYGGRQASMLAAEDSSVADGLLLLSYPLHPPRKPHDLRTAHFSSLRTPCLFVHGTADPFGSIEEMRAALALIGTPVRLLEVAGAGHDLKGAPLAEILTALRQLEASRAGGALRA